MGWSIPSEVVKKLTCIQLGCLRGHKFSGFCIRLEFEMITPMYVQNSIFNGKVFQIEVADWLVHSLRSCQTVNLYLAWVFTGAHEKFVCVYNSN